MDLQQLSKKASSGDVDCELASVHLITSPCIYYHYLCDEVDDRVQLMDQGIIIMHCLYLTFPLRGGVVATEVCSACVPG